MSDKQWDALNYRRFDDLQDSSESEGDGHPNIDMGSWKRMKKRMRDEKGLPPRGAAVHDAFNYSNVNKNKSNPHDNPTEKQVEEFFKKSKSKLMTYCKIKNDADADEFIQKNPEIVTSSGEGFLITHAVDTSCLGEPASLAVPLYARRCLTVHNILASAKDANVKAQIAVQMFYKQRKSKRVVEMYEPEFEKQYQELLGLIKKRTKERLLEAEEEAKRRAKEGLNEEEVEEMKAPLGPGGLDPTKVLNELPKDMQDAFMEKDVAKLQSVIASMDPEKARDLMDKCVKSGLWVDNAAAAAEEAVETEQEQNGDRAEQAVKNAAVPDKSE